MATVVDSLVLEFGLDPAKFTKDQRDVLDQMRRFEQEAERIGGRAENQGRKTVDLMSALRRETLGVVAALGGAYGFKQMVSNVASLDAATGRVALTMNMSAREVSAWDGAAKQAAGSAGEMKTTLSALTADMNKFMLTGQTAMGPLLNTIGVSMVDDNNQLKDAGVLVRDIVSAMDRLQMDPARRATFLSMLPGMTEGSLALMMKSRKELEEYLQVARNIGGTTAESADALQKYERSVSNLNTAFTNLQRTITVGLEPALTGLANIWTKTLSAFGSDESLGGIKKGSLLHGLIESSMGRSDKTTWEVAKEWWNGKQEAPAGPSAAVPAGRRAATSRNEVIAYIRQSAVKRGIDPDIAVEVARREGLDTYIGDKGSSFGPFQLHYGGVAPGMMQKGLGDSFTAKTGLNARDETTWKEQIDFALDTASKPGGRGWADWYGWKGAPFAGISPGGGGGGSRTSSTYIQNQNIYTQATNGKEIADSIKPYLEQATDTVQFNTGAE